MEEDKDKKRIELPTAPPPEEARKEVNKMPPQKETEASAKKIEAALQADSENPLPAPIIRTPKDRDKEIQQKISRLRTVFNESYREHKAVCKLLNNQIAIEAADIQELKEKLQAAHDQDNLLEFRDLAKTIISKIYSIHEKEFHMTQMAEKVIKKVNDALAEEIEEGM